MRTEDDKYFLDCATRDNNYRSAGGSIKVRDMMMKRRKKQKKAFSSSTRTSTRQRFLLKHIGSARDESGCHVCDVTMNLISGGSPFPHVFEIEEGG